jgi:small nuclear ribonucleoprotein (snRNP)-like protein
MYFIGNFQRVEQYLNIVLENLSTADGIGNDRSSVTLICLFKNAKTKQGINNN